MRLKRRARPLVGPSLVSMIDVLMIMLIFFMVTSTYLNLRMMPLTRGAEPPGAALRGDASGRDAAPAETPLLVRLGADGTPYLRGRALSAPDLRAALAAAPGRRVVVLPSARAPLQALVTLSERLRAAGAGSVAVIRPEGGP